MTVEVHLVPVTAFEQNCAIVVDSRSREAIVVDPGGDSARILAALRRLELTPKEIWLTHSHLDHCGAVAELKRQFDLKLLGCEVEREFRARVEEIAVMYGLGSAGFENCPEPDRYLVGGESLKVGESLFEVRFTPGHSPGHIVFISFEQGFVLGGDTIFAGGIGRTDLPGGNQAQLMDSIRTQLLTLPDELRVYPGHGPTTTVGKERRTNPFLT